VGAVEVALVLAAASRWAPSRIGSANLADPPRLSTRVKIEGDPIRKIEGRTASWNKGADDGLQPRRAA
jgi:hypothetical protein